MPLWKLEVLNSKFYFGETEPCLAKKNYITKLWHNTQNIMTQHTKYHVSHVTSKYYQGAQRGYLLVLIRLVLLVSLGFVVLILVLLVILLVLILLVFRVLR